MKYFFITLLLCYTSTLFSQRILVEEEPILLGKEINSDAEEVQPIRSQNGTLYFVRTFHNRNVGGIKGGQDIWFSQKDTSNNQWVEPTNFLKFNNAYNNALVGISSNDSVIYLLNSYSSPLRWRFGISTSDRAEQGWTEAREFPIDFEPGGDLRGYYVSPDENVILASLEKQDSYGQEDLYLYYKSGDKWNGPIHFDEKINTEFSEISPFITPDHRVIFFASQGHDGLGGFDIFSSERLDESWENWSPAKNLGRKINTEAFDGYFSTNEEGDSFFSSSRRGSTDIYQVKIRVKLLGIKSDVIASSEELQKSFRKALMMDTTLHQGLFEISEASTTSETHNLENFIRGNDLFNRRLIGIEERDSLINLYVSEQLYDDISPLEIDKRKLWNRALSEDIQLAVNRNRDVDVKLKSMTINGINSDNEITEQRIYEIKSRITEQGIKNIDAKQKLSELVAQNAFNKHLYSQFYSNYDQRRNTEESILNNNDLISSELNQWFEGLAIIEDLIGELTGILSTEKILLASTAKEKLSAGSLLERLGSVLTTDTTFNGQLSSVLDKDTTLFNDINPSLSASDQMSRNLLDVKKQDSSLRGTILKTGGLEISSEKLTAFNQSADLLIKNIFDNTQTNRLIFDESNTSSGDAKDVNTTHLLGYLTAAMQVKNGISDLIERNVQLKREIPFSNDGGAYSSKLIEENESLLDSQIDSLETLVEDLEKELLDLEQEYSQKAYLAHILNLGIKSFSQLPKVLLVENIALEDVTSLADFSSILALVDQTRMLNDSIVSPVEKYVDLNEDYIENQTSISASEVDKLGIELDIQKLVANDQFADSIAFRAYVLIQDRGEELGEDEKELISFLIESSNAKSEILELFDENVQLRNKLILSDTLKTSAVNLFLENAKKIEKKIAYLIQVENKLSMVSDSLKAMEEKKKKLREILIKKKEIHQLITNAVNVDSVVQESLLKTSKNDFIVQQSTLNKNQINPKISQINDSYLSIGYSEFDGIDSSIKNRDTKASIEFSSSIASLNVELDSLLKPAIQASDSADDVSFLQSLAKLKEELSSLIFQNTVYETFLDTTNSSINDHFFINAIDQNQDHIFGKILEWNTLNESILPDNSYLSLRNTLDGYTVQVLAMPHGIQPLNSYLDNLNLELMIISKGKDGLDRYHLGKYETKKQALKAMRKLRGLGYRDAFVRAIIKYESL